MLKVVHGLYSVVESKKNKHNLAFWVVVNSDKKSDEILFQEIKTDTKMSILLPKSKEEFGQSDYWNSFFKARGSKAFEWYGEYNELSNYLHKYIKKEDKVLITGCGNSMLGQNLYDVGYRDITNIDISSIVIKQMNQKVKIRSGLAYTQMDALNTTFKDEIFSVILDKGTLDALMPDDSEQTLDKINKYFKEIHRLTKFGSRYICITLLQEHILNKLLEFFPKHNWMFRIVRCSEAEQAAVEKGEKLIPVFMVICTKFKTLPNQILELNLNSSEKSTRCQNSEQVKAAILSSQKATFICSSLQHNSISSENEVCLELHKSDSSDIKYTVFVIDIPPAKKNAPYAVFIVPQGRESEWIFSTKPGRKKLALVSNFNRLLVVVMHRNQTYGTLDDIQNELANMIRDLTPPRMKRQKIPCLSLGSEGVGKREILKEGLSDLSGGYIVEDVVVDGNKFRRLYFLNNQLVIQSEAKMKSHKNRKGIIKEVPDLTYLTCRHHVHMLLGTHVACSKKDCPSVAVLGVGGGGLCSFLNKFLSNAKIVGVEIDPEIAKIAVDWFGLKINDKLNIEVADGLKYLQQIKNNGLQMNAILFDVDNKDSSIGMSCPPIEFLDNDVLKNVKDIIEADGVFIVNVVLRDELLRDSVVKKLIEHFKFVACYKIDEDLNEIFICGKNADAISKRKFEEAAKELTSFLTKCDSSNCINNENLLDCVDDYNFISNID